MCGIIGATGYDWLQGREAEGRFAELRDVLHHRGPDAAGQANVRFGSGRLWMGHRRLSIIDLSDAANQPFEKDGLTIVFNGEIYNYQALADALKTQHGVVFRTHGDTEVILEAWRCWGPAALLRLRGMFAFAIYDSEHECLTLARDRFGIKPLFYTQPEGGAFAFASELKALRPLLKTPTINPTAMLASMLYNWVPENRCIWGGVARLPAGHFLTRHANGRTELNRYFDPAEQWREPRGPSATVDEVRAVVEDSVRSHMVADVPVASFLSGGLDSSLISVIAARQVERIDAYTIAFSAQDKQHEAIGKDDLYYARELASQHANIYLHEIELSPDAGAMLPDVVRWMDEPIGDSAAINVYLMCEAAKQAGVKVLLSGMGGDELFAGYRKHYACLLAQRYRQVPAWVRHAAKSAIKPLPVAIGGRGIRPMRLLKRFLFFADLPDEMAFHQATSQYDANAWGAMVPEARLDAVEPIYAYHRELFNAGPEDYVNRMCWTDVQHYMPSHNLAYTDRASMAASVEVRVPYVDQEVADVAFRVAGSQKIMNGEMKSALKRAAEPWLPKDVIYRRKDSFCAPLRAWMREHLRDQLEVQLPKGRLVEQGWVRPEALKTMLEENHSGREDHAQRLWQLLTMEEWLRQNS